MNKVEQIKQHIDALKPYNELYQSLNGAFVMGELRDMMWICYGYRLARPLSDKLDMRHVTEILKLLA